MGLMPQEFWSLTFKEFFLFADAFSEREYRQDYRAASIIAAIYTVNMDQKKRKKPYTAEEILGVKRSKAQKKQQTDGDMLANVKMWARLIGGE